MTADQLARRVLEKLGQTWDNLPSGIDPGDIDPDALRYFIHLARGRLPRVNAEETPERLLENLHLLRSGALTNTGALLFTQKPQRLFPSAQVHIGRFQGGQVRDDRTVSGTLWSQLEGVLEALRGILHVRFETRPHAASIEGMQRQESPAISRFVWAKTPWTYGVRAYFPKGSVLPILSGKGTCPAPGILRWPRCFISRA